MQISASHLERRGPRRFFPDICRVDPTRLTQVGFGGEFLVVGAGLQRGASVRGAREQRGDLVV